MRTFSLMALMAGFVVISGCAESTTDTVADTSASTESEVTLANEVCPIMGKPVKDGGGTAEWNGKTVGFCCPGCIKKWDALSEDEKVAKLAANETAATGSCCSEGAATCCKDGDSGKACCKDGEASACCKNAEAKACCKDGGEAKACCNGQPADGANGAETNASNAKSEE